MNKSITGRYTAASILLENRFGPVGCSLASVADHLLGLAIAGVLCLGASSSESHAQPTDGSLAKTMLQSTGSRGGLCVHVGAGDDGFAVQLSQGGQYLVHGLGSSSEEVQAARKNIAAAGLSAAVSVERWSGRKLPHADNLVNLLVADDLAGILKQGLEIGEIARVLAPGGVAWLGQAGDTRKPLQALLAKAGVKDFEIVQGPGTWATVTKPRPPGMGVWTHAKHDASNNPVSTDDEMGMPDGIRWAAGPTWPTGGRKGAISTRVVSSRHLVYVFEDEIQAADGPQRQWSLIVRDACNGLLLWRKKVNPHRGLVSVGDLVYTDQGGKLTALLEDPFIHDGMAISGRRLYATTQSGKIICLGDNN
jgi:hypothetical protein